MMISYIIFALQLGFMLSPMSATAQGVTDISPFLQTFVTAMTSPLSLCSLLTTFYLKAAVIAAKQPEPLL
jgi:hypothetical protein